MSEIEDNDLSSSQSTLLALAIAIGTIALTAAGYIVWSHVLER